MLLFIFKFLQGAAFSPDTLSTSRYFRFSSSKIILKSWYIIATTKIAINATGAINNTIIDIISSMIYFFYIYHNYYLSTSHLYQCEYKRSRYKGIWNPHYPPTPWFQEWFVLLILPLVYFVSLLYCSVKLSIWCPYVALIYVLWIYKQVPCHFKRQDNTRLKIQQHIYIRLWKHLLLLKNFVC